MKRIFTFPTIILVLLPSAQLLLVVIGWSDWKDFIQLFAAMFLGGLLRIVLTLRGQKQSSPNNTQPQADVPESD
jgi:hypothetical protein